MCGAFADVGIFEIRGGFVKCLFFPFHLFCSPFFSFLPIIVVTQIQGLIAGSSSPFPMRSVPCIFIARILRPFLPRRFASNCAYPLYTTWRSLQCTYLLSIFRTFANFSLHTSTFRQNTISKCSDTGNPAGHTDWSRSRRDPCTLKRVAGARSFFPAGVDKTISLVSVREAFFYTYVPLKCRHPFG